MNRTVRFHSLSSEFSLYLELELSDIHSSTSEISSVHRLSELFTRFFVVESNTLISFCQNGKIAYTCIILLIYMCITVIVT